MSTGFKRSSNPDGSHMVICDRSGFQINSEDAVLEKRTGLIVYKDFVQDWTPLDFPPKLLPEPIIRHARPPGESSYYARRVFEDTNGNVFVSTKISPDDTRFTPSSTSIDDLAPNIEDQSFSFGSSAAQGDLIGTVVATDAQNDTLTYAITAGNDDAIFSINAANGNLYFDTIALLDLDTIYQITVTVTDDSSSRLSASATITIRPEPFYPPDFATAVLWLDAQDANTITTETGVSQWSDKSGNGYHFLQATAGNQPDYVSGEYVEFDGVDEYLDSNQSASFWNFLHDGSAYTIVMVISPNSEQNLNATYMLQTTSSSTRGLWGTFSPGNLANNREYVEFVIRNNNNQTVASAGGLSPQDSVPFAVKSTVFFVHQETAGIGNPAAELFVNNSSIEVGNQQRNYDTGNATNTLRIGAANSVSDNTSCNFKLYELVIFDGALDDATLTAIEAALVEKHSIS